MHFKKIITVWTVLALAFAQIAIAQHSSVHLDHGFQSIQAETHASANQEPNNEDVPESHECPECLLVKSLQTAFYSDSAITVVSILKNTPFLSSNPSYVSNAVASAYTPRAPPLLLI